MAGQSHGQSAADTGGAADDYGDSVYNVQIVSEHDSPLCSQDLGKRGHIRPAVTCLFLGVTLRLSVSAVKILGFLYVSVGGRGHGGNQRRKDNVASIGVPLRLSAAHFRPWVLVTP
jgi:hypothetical protein